MADWYKKLGDDGFPFRCQLSWEGGYADLSGCTVKLRYVSRSVGAASVEVAAAVESASDRIVTAAFEPASTGSYKAEWEVTWPNATQSTFPEDEYLILEVLTSLEPA
jgi:hypothetical protein